ncbi:MAG TPA: ATPase domain-containing protein [Vicinamibacteria bacterium]|nr:ATPase domain-containing protein [Vicinamibacteria bacterium]
MKAVSNSHTVVSAGEPPAPTARTTTGLSGLDAVLEGGFPAGRSVLVCGAPGTGKTTLAVQFLAAGMAEGTPGVLVTVDQKPRHVIDDAARFGWPLAEAVNGGALLLLDPAPYFTAGRDPAKRLEARQLTAELARRTRELGAGRLVIDSLGSLLPHGLPCDDIREFLRTLVFAVEDNLRCTTLFTWSDRGRGRGRPEADPRQAEMETLASGVLDLKLRRRADGRYERRLFVRKMRGTATELTERPYAIRPGLGLVLVSG